MAVYRPSPSHEMYVPFQRVATQLANVPFHMCFPADPSESVSIMRLVWKSLDKMRCFRKRSTIPFLGVLITCLLFLNLYMEDGYVLVSLLLYFSLES